MGIKFFFLMMFLLIGGVAHSLPLSQNDVSILMLLPKPDSLDLLLKPSIAANFGQLLPKSIFSHLPNLDLGDQDKLFENLRVVGVRIDPCFFQFASPEVCQAQIRLVWQPVGITGDGRASAEDCAVHTFYNIEKNEFSSLVADLESLKDQSGSTAANESLNINPTLQSLGLESVYAKHLFKLLLRNTGESRLSRITFMQLTGSGNVWTFGGFNVVAGSLQKMSVARVNNETQTFSNGVLGAIPNYFSGDISPAPNGPDTLNLLIRNSSVIATSDKDAVTESTLSAAQIENPLNHNANNTDCVSCHTAQPARLWAINQQ